MRPTARYARENPSTTPSGAYPCVSSPLPLRFLVLSPSLFSPGSPYAISPTARETGRRGRRTSGTPRERVPPRGEAVAMQMRETICAHGADARAKIRAREREVTRVDDASCRLTTGRTLRKRAEINARSARLTLTSGVSINYREAFSFSLFDSSSPFINFSTRRSADIFILSTTIERKGRVR